MSDVTTLPELSEADIERLVKEFCSSTEKSVEEQIAEAELEIKQIEDFWNGLLTPDAAAERFDKPGAIVLSIEQSTWECDDWLKVYKVKIQTRGGRQLGRFEYRVVNLACLRSHMCPDFDLHFQFHASERAGNELESFGKRMFKRNGDPNPRFYEGASNAFGPELTYDSFALICGEDNGGDWDFCVDKEFRQRGVGTQAIRELFKHHTLKHAAFIFVWPYMTQFPSQLKKKPVGEKAFNILTQFFRKAGFRRVGNSPCMAYALHDSDHPSRLIGADRDTPIPYW